MNNAFSPFFRLLRLHSLRPFVLALLLIGFGEATSYGQSKDQPKKELSDKVSEALGGPIKTAHDASKFADAIRLIDPLIASSPPISYDRALLLVEKAQDQIQLNQSIEAAAPLEEGLKLGDTYGFFDKDTTLTIVQTLAQIYGQEAQTTKQVDEQRRLYAKAYVYFRRLLDQSPTPTAEMEQFASSILLGQASINPDKVDLGLVKQAQVETEKGMRMAIAPKEPFYVLLLAELQQEGDLKRSAEILELLVKMSPNNKNYWQPLAQTYVQLASDGENVDYYLRAILAIERAQQYGMLNTAKDNYTLVGIYLNIRQYDRAIQLLEAGLHNGSIENTEDNWKLLANSYHELHKEQKAIDALKDASRHFPKSGEIDVQIGQLYYGMDKPAEAYSYIKMAVEKGKVSHPSQNYFLLAYLAYELKKFDEALDFVQKSLKADPHSKEAIHFLESVKEAIKDRDAQKNPSA